MELYSFKRPTGTGGASTGRREVPQKDVMSCSDYLRRKSFVGTSPIAAAEAPAASFESLLDEKEAQEWHDYQKNIKRMAREARQGLSRQTSQESCTDDDTEGARVAPVPDAGHADYSFGATLASLRATMAKSEGGARSAEASPSPLPSKDPVGGLKQLRASLVRSGPLSLNAGTMQASLPRRDPASPFDTRASSSEPGQVHGASRVSGGLVQGDTQPRRMSGEKDRTGVARRPLTHTASRSNLCPSALAAGAAGEVTLQSQLSSVHVGPPSNGGSRTARDEVQVERSASKGNLSRPMVFTQWDEPEEGVPLPLQRLRSVKSGQLHVRLPDEAGGSGQHSSGGGAGTSESPTQSAPGSRLHIHRAPSRQASFLTGALSSLAHSPRGSTCGGRPSSRGDMLTCQGPSSLEDTSRSHLNMATRKERQSSQGEVLMRQPSRVITSDNAELSELVRQVDEAQAHFKRLIGSRPVEVSETGEPWERQRQSMSGGSRAMLGGRPSTAGYGGVELNSPRREPSACMLPLLTGPGSGATRPTASCSQVPPCGPMVQRSGASMTNLAGMGGAAAWRGSSCTQLAAGATHQGSKGTAAVGGTRFEASTGREAKHRVNFQVEQGKSSAGAGAAHKLDIHALISSAQAEAS